MQTDDLNTDQLESEPDDVAPMREEDCDNPDLQLDDEDDADEDDAPPAPCVAPAGFAFAVPPSVEALAFSKEPSEAAEALVGKSILFHWGSIGWHCGVLQRRVTDGRIKRGGQQCNFYVYYEVDDDEVPTVLLLDAYGIDEECGWWLLEETGANV